MAEREKRRRGAVLEQAIVDAAWQLMRERGWSGFTIEAVAARSGAAKTVIYRRWRNRVELVQDMLQRVTEQPTEPFRSSGDLRSDLLMFLQNMSQFLMSPFGDATRGVICEGTATNAVSVFGGEPIVAIVAHITDQALSRGELERTPSALAVNIGHAVVMSEFLHTGSPPSRAGLEELVDAVWLPALRATSQAQTR